ncbi:MAG: hypothetical protein ACOYOH_26265 [Paracraurococcus sp.]
MTRTVSEYGGHPPRASSRRGSVSFRSSVLGLAVFLGGCTTPSWLCWFPAGPGQVSIEAAEDANRHRAVALDIVFVSNAQAAAQVAGLTAREWFARREQLRRDWREALTIHSWEVTPGQRVPEARLSPPCNLVRSLAFADYATPGEHRAQLGTAARLQVALGASGFGVSP